MPSRKDQFWDIHFLPYYWIFFCLFPCIRVSGQVLRKSVPPNCIVDHCCESPCSKAKNKVMPPPIIYFSTKGFRLPWYWLSDVTCVNKKPFFVLCGISKMKLSLGEKTTFWHDKNKILVPKEVKWGSRYLICPPRRILPLRSSLTEISPSWFAPSWTSKTVSSMHFSSPNWVVDALLWP